MGAPARVINGHKAHNELKPFKFRCSVTSSNKLKLVFPLMDCSERGNDDEQARQVYQGTDFFTSTPIMSALDTGRNGYKERSQEYQTREMEYILIFKEGVKLSASALAMNSKKKKKKKKGDPEKEVCKPYVIDLDVPLEQLNDEMVQNLKVEDLMSRRIKDQSGKDHDVFFAAYREEKVVRLVFGVADLNADIVKEGRGSDSSSEDEDDWDMQAAMRRSRKAAGISS